MDFLLHILEYIVWAFVLCGCVGLAVLVLAVAGIDDEDQPDDDFNDLCPSLGDKRLIESDRMRRLVDAALSGRRLEPGTCCPNRGNG